MRVAAASLVLSLVAGCASAKPPSPIAPEPPSPVAITGDGPIVPAEDELPGGEDLPRSIRRLVVEQRDEVRSITELAAELRDRHGRERALREADALSQELTDIEAALGATDSASLDRIVVRLHRLATKTALIHDALQQATL